MAETIVLVVLGLALAILVAQPLLRPRVRSTLAEGERDTLALRRSIAYDAIRDLDADYRAGSLSLGQHQVLRDEAEQHAAAALAALEGYDEAPPPDAVESGEIDRQRRGRRLAGGLAGLLAVALLVGFALPAPLSLANGTIINQPLANAMAAEDNRVREIERLLATLSQDPRDPATLSSLADLYLAGSSRDDLVRAAWALLAVIGLQPDNRSARARIVTAYIRAGDFVDAAAATDALARLAPDSPDVAFFRGVIALRGDFDNLAATAAFDRFLELAPNDPRASMVRGLRAEAARKPAPGS